LENFGLEVRRLDDEIGEIGAVEGNGDRVELVVAWDKSMLNEIVKVG